MKRILAFLPLLVFVLLFCGCSSILGNSAERLIEPIALPEKNQGIYNALRSFCDGDFLLKTPVSGDYKTSFVFYDFDGDGGDEALAFYEYEDSESASMAVLDEYDDGWSVICNIDGDGKDVFSVDMRTLLADGGTQLIVLWDTSVDSAVHYLSVYAQTESNGFSGFKKIGTSVRASAYAPVDNDGRGFDELLIFNVGSGGDTASSAALFTVSESGLKSRSGTKLDGHITSYVNVVSESKDKGFKVFADAVRADGKGMLTELIVWSDYYGEILAPYYNYNTGRTENTSRNAFVFSRDINSDGYIELPTDTSVISAPKGVKAFDWKRYGSVLQHACYSLFIEKDGYHILLPDKYAREINASYDAASGLLEIKDKSGKTAFNIEKLALSEYQKNAEKYSDLTEIYRDDAYIYFAGLGSDSDIKINMQTLKSMIIIGKGE